MYIYIYFHPLIISFIQTHTKYIYILTLNYTVYIYTVYTHPSRDKTPAL